MIRNFFIGAGAALLIMAFGAGEIALLTFGMERIGFEWTVGIFVAVVTIGIGAAAAVFARR